MQKDFHYPVLLKLILRTENGPQYISGEFRSSMKIMNIGQEYIQKHTPEENGDIESFHNSLKRFPNKPLLLRLFRKLIDL